MSRDPLNDSLDHLFDGLAPEKPQTVAVPFKTGADYEPTINRLVVEKCKACRGTGRFISYAGRDCGPCFKCKGQGEKAYRTSTEQRARQREKAADKRDEKQAELGREAAAYIEAHKEVFDMLIAAAKRNADKGGDFLFPQSMCDAVFKYGSLTERQLEACERMLEKDKARRAEWAARDQQRPACDASLLTAAFQKARQYALDKAPNATGVIALRLTIQSYTFSPDKTGNGEVWARGANGWLGKTEGGKFKRFRVCSDADEAAILAICSDPSAAAKAHGLATNNCACCQRQLTNPESVARGIGPICAERYGF